MDRSWITRHRVNAGFLQIVQQPIPVAKADLKQVVDVLLVFINGLKSNVQICQSFAIGRRQVTPTLIPRVQMWQLRRQDELIRHYETVLDAVDVNIVLYSYPLKDGADISFELMDHFADNPRVIGIKESSGSLQRAIDIHSRYDGRIQLVSGSDDIALDFMFWGADSWICGPSNCMARACCDLDRTFKAGDMARAREIMKTLYRAMNILESGKFVQKIKYGCGLQGLPVGECRAPLGPLTEAEKADLKEAMAPILNW